MATDTDTITLTLTRADAEQVLGDLMSAYSEEWWGCSFDVDLPVYLEMGTARYGADLSTPRSRAMHALRDALGYWVHPRADVDAYEPVRLEREKQQRITGAERRREDQANGD